MRDKELRNLVGKMSLEDKLAEITQLYGNESGEANGTLMGIDYRFQAKQHMVDNIGSVLGVAGAELVKEAQKRHLEVSKHKIPLLFMHDVIHGFKTIFPSPLAMSCSWQPGLVKRAAEIAAKEAAVSGVHLTFSPMCDLARDARWGRVVETSGEDVYLNGLFARAYVEGYQGKDVSSQFKIASCLKHFAGYGMAEGGRDYNTTDISEYTLREYHLPSYKAAIDAGAKMVMTSFNTLNGVPSSGNKWLFQDVLRDEWGFEGTVISDCTAIIEMIKHGFAEDEADAAYKAIEAGVDIEMVSNTYYNNAIELIRAGRLSETQIDDAVYRVLRLKNELGLFENPYKDADERLEQQFVLCAEHKNEARRVACNSIVLLENDGILPIEKKQKAERKVVLLGPYAKACHIFDSWAIYGDERECISLETALRERMEIFCAEGVGITEYEEGKVTEALTLAEEGDVIILALGEDPLMSGESNSRMDIGLPGYQETFAERILALGKQVIIILYSGRPLAVPKLAQRTNALVQAWFPGTEGSRAVVDILLGEQQPSARLTMSFPYAAGQCPIYYDRYSSGRPAANVYESDRFSLRYIDGPSVPLYPFGYGLTYTTFFYGKVSLSKKTMNRGESILASCRIENVGKREGTETVQLYIRDMAGSLVRPIRMLRGFERITLEPGENREVCFEITEAMLRFYTLEKGFVAEPGKFRVYIAKDASVEEYATFELV